MATECALASIVSVVPLAQYLGPTGCALLRIVSKGLAATQWTSGDKPCRSLSEIILQSGVGVRRSRSEDSSPTAEKRRKENRRFQRHLIVDEIFNFVHCNAQVTEKAFDEWDAYEITPQDVYPPVCACLLRWRHHTPFGLVKWLVDKKADINATLTLPMDFLAIRSNYVTTATPLVIATAVGTLDMTRKLFELGADCWLELTKSSTSRALNMRPKVTQHHDVATLCRDVAWHTDNSEMLGFWEQKLKHREQPNRGTLLSACGACLPRAQKCEKL